MLRILLMTNLFLFTPAIFHKLWGQTVVPSSDVHNQQSTIQWKNNPFEIKNSKFVKSQRVVFDGINTKGHSVVIDAVVPDCVTCVNLSVSDAVVNSHSKVTITGDVILKHNVETLKGRLAVYYEGIKQPDILSYQISSVSPFSFSESNLIWVDDINPKRLVLTINTSLGISFEGVRVDSSNFTYSVESITPEEIVFIIQPTENKRVKGAMFFNFKYVDPSNFSNKKYLPDAAYVTLTFDGYSSLEK